MSFIIRELACAGLGSMIGTGLGCAFGLAKYKSFSEEDQIKIAERSMHQKEVPDPIKEGMTTGLVKGIAAGGLVEIADHCIYQKIAPKKPLQFSSTKAFFKHLDKELIMSDRKVRAIYFGAGLFSSYKTCYGVFKNAFSR